MEIETLNASGGSRSFHYHNNFKIFKNRKFFTFISKVPRDRLRNLRPVEFSTANDRMEFHPEFAP